MKKRTILIIVAAVLVVVMLVPLGGAVAGVLPQPESRQAAGEQNTERPALAQQHAELIPSLSGLLEYPHEVHIVPLEGPDATIARDLILARPEVGDLMDAMAAKGFVFNPEQAEVMQVATESLDPTGIPEPVVITVVTMQTIHDELSAALTAMVDNTNQGFFQAHHTNLDPQLAQVPDPPIIVNGMPYFYITTLRWMQGRIIHWNYWWFDSHHHPNWYYSHYYWYWKYYWWYNVDWNYWYWWAHGWYYWRYWYYWSTWFPY